LPHVPHTFLHALWTSRKDIACSGQHDAHECFISLANAIHSALDGREFDNVKSGPSANCSCVVHATFGGVLRSQLTCPTCTHATVREDPFLDISLDVKGTELHAVHSITKAPGLGPGYRITLTQCLSKFTCPETVTFKCSACQQDHVRNFYAFIS
jgi:ubiquitin carboxyl-terminal hydrolase 22/27/51